MRLSRYGFAVAAAFVALVFVAPARAELFISIDKSAQQMTVTVDGTEMYVWPVSTGAPGYDTPTGEYKPFRMEKDHFSREWDDAPMPNSIFFTQQGHALHGSNHVKAIGTPASHGCVRLEPRNAAILFALVKAEHMSNTRVVLTGETPSANELVARRGPSDDDDVTASVPVRRQRSARDYQDYSRSYYYRERPYYVRRYYGSPLPFPFRW